MDENSIRRLQDWHIITQSLHLIMLLTDKPTQEQIDKAKELIEYLQKHN